MPRAKNTEMRQQILTTSYALFLEKGYDNVLMKEIANECGISPVLLQHYFSKKEDILVHIVYNILYRTTEYLKKNDAFFASTDKRLLLDVWKGCYYRLFYSLLCRDNLKLLKLYTGVLFNAPLLQRGITLCVEPFYQVTGFPSNALNIDTSSSIDVYLLNGCLSQLVSLYLKGDQLMISPETLVNRALSVVYRDARLTADDEAYIFDIISQIITSDNIREYFDYIDSHSDQYILME